MSAGNTSSASAGEVTTDDVKATVAKLAGELPGGQLLVRVTVAEVADDRVVLDFINAIWPLTKAEFLDGVEYGLITTARVEPDASSHDLATDDDSRFGGGKPWVEAVIPPEGFDYEAGVGVWTRRDGWKPEEGFDYYAGYNKSYNEGAEDGYRRGFVETLDGRPGCRIVRLYSEPFRTSTGHLLAYATGYMQHYGKGYNDGVEAYDHLMEEIEAAPPGKTFNLGEALAAYNAVDETAAQDDQRK